MHFAFFKNIPFFVDEASFRHRVKNDPYVIPNDPPTSLAFKEMLEACFEKHPEKRITTLKLKKMYCFDRFAIEDLSNLLSAQNGGRNLLAELESKDKRIRELERELLEKN